MNGRWSTVGLCILGMLLAGVAAAAPSNPPEPAFPNAFAGLGSLPMLTDAHTRSISAENPTGEPGKGGMAVPNPSEPKPAAAARAADNLGQGWKVRPFLRINAGETATLMDVNGPGVFQHMWLVEGLSRAHILRFYWDGEKTPSIEVPAPDFFAIGHEKFARVNSLAVVANPQNAMNCYWPMPFRKHAKVTLTNEADKDLELVAYQITYVETDVPANAAYFHAQWRRARTDKVNPYVILDGVKGKGRYVGTFLAWTQFEKGWFGEGEIKFYMDGDKEFPTICGTGTEDYFCGSYGFAEPYTTAYVGTTLPSKDSDTPPTYWSLYRWHIQDPICYDNDLRVTIQALGWGTDGKYKLMSDDIASVAYWYQEEPHAPFPALPALADRAPCQAPPKKVAGALEGEELKVIAVTGGKAERQDVDRARWSGAAHLWWTGAKPGDTLDLAVPVKEAGKYRLKVQLTKSYDYGIVQLALDGHAVGDSVDLYQKDSSPAGELDLGVRELKAGDHKFQIKITGANKDAQPLHMAGIDYVLLEKQ